VRGTRQKARATRPTVPLYDVKNASRSVLNCS
jgi:hypothetical protein